jgi:thioredoxin reductase
VEQNVNVLLGAKVDRACVRGDVASVTFRTSDGTEKTIDAEHVISATGFRVDMRRLNFINPRIMDRLALADQTPLLSPHFETSVPGLFMVGITAANNFGPLLRFAYGAGFASDRLSRFLHQTTVRRSVAVKRNLTTA